MALTRGTFYSLFFSSVDRSIINGESLPKKIFRRGFPSVTLLEENFQTVYINLLMIKNDPWIEEFNDMILVYSQSGLAQHNILYVYNYKILLDEVPPLVLTMFHLEIGFQIIIAMLGFSASAFLLEVIFDRILAAFYQGLGALSWKRFRGALSARAPGR